MQTYPEHSMIEAPIPANKAPRLNNRGRYEDLMAVVRQSTDWVAITDLDAVTGDTMKAKATAIHSAARVRRMQVQTSAQHGFLYCKLISAEVA
jgi:hypothetical protein